MGGCKTHIRHINAAAITALISGVFMGLGPPVITSFAEAGDLSQRRCLSPRVMPPLAAQPAGRKSRAAQKAEIIFKRALRDEQGRPYMWSIQAMWETYISGVLSLNSPDNPDGERTNFRVVKANAVKALRQNIRNGERTGVRKLNILIISGLENEINFIVKAIQEAFDKEGVAFGPWWDVRIVCTNHPESRGERNPSGPTDLQKAQQAFRALKPAPNIQAAFIAMDNTQPEHVAMLLDLLKRLFPGGLDCAVATLIGARHTTSSFIVDIIAMLKPEGMCVTDSPKIKADTFSGRYLISYPQYLLRFICPKSWSSALFEQLNPVTVEEWSPALLSRYAAQKEWIQQQLRNALHNGSTDKIYVAVSAGVVIGIYVFGIDLYPQNKGNGVLAGSSQYGTTIAYDAGKRPLIIVKPKLVTMAGPYADGPYAMWLVRESTRMITQDSLKIVLPPYLPNKRRDGWLTFFHAALHSVPAMDTQYPGYDAYYIDYTVFYDAAFTDMDFGGCYAVSA